MNCYEQAMNCLQYAMRELEEAMCYVQGLDYQNEVELYETINLQRKETQMEIAWQQHLEDLEEQWSVFR